MGDEMRALQKWITANEDFIYAPAALLLRFVMARVFFLSGQTKVSGPAFGGQHFGFDLSFKWPTGLSESAVALFEDEYKLPLLPPELAAYAAAAAEHVLPVLLLLGLFTRLSALGLLIMTLVIQLFVFPDAWWTVHAYWTALLLTLIAKGAGALSLDRLIFGRG
jgi:putative oxidoreductase